MMKIKKSLKNQGGFTLVEMAIVLVIIGLIVGAIMKGQSLIQEAKVKNVINQVNGLRAAILTFYDRYGMYPGDENLSNIPEGDQHNGNGNGQVDTTEGYYLFEDLRLSGLITGSYSGNSGDTPHHVFGDNIYFYWTTPTGGTAGHWFKLDNLPWDVAMEIDQKLDDGIYNTGSVIANEQYVSSSGSIGSLYIKF
ncbi:hypothetical protein DBT_1581 [Dissulfuribacter thermophilus]|uniref:Prepilin-type N-terminal cleavage/methylation domain-containing protein n=1 Tax=Dissulfuribacter thermophilus TaxID=1156395 RepID=A0A1B9F5K8_9BACT|nr:type II secretion system protein [Dissulfuribacter thermophilus]OCC15095.1 hypothetical protein DBT_1581 [Dissulfuribacter thermophilus]